MGFYNWKRARLAKRGNRQRWTMRHIKELLHWFKEAEVAGAHIEILGYVECNECYASTPLDDVLDETGLHLERMWHGKNEKDQPCTQNKRPGGVKPE